MSRSELINSICESGLRTKDSCKWVVPPIYQEDDESGCDNHSTSVIDVASKVLTGSTVGPLLGAREGSRSELQIGFRPIQGRIVHVFSMRPIHQSNLTFGWFKIPAFLDLKPASGLVYCLFH